MNICKNSVAPLFLVLLYGIYGGQLQMFFLFLLYYIIGLGIIKFVMRSNHHETYQVYRFFFCIYGLLTLLTQIELIHNPEEDYFIHIDAPFSFYQNTIDTVTETAWSDIIHETLFSLRYFDYFLAELLYATIAKSSMDFGLLDIRLALRGPSFIMGALIMSMIIEIIMRNGHRFADCYKMVVFFGCCSYLFITSAIFSRDIFVCFFYSAIAYVYLLPKCKYRLAKLVLLTICAFGGRPESGALASLFIVGFILSKRNGKVVKIFAIIILVVAFLSFILYTTFLQDSIESIIHYQERAKSNTGGFFEIIYNLPFPINQLSMVVYMLLAPLPYTFYMTGEGGSILTFPFVLSPYLMSLVLISCLWFSMHYYKKEKQMAMLIIMTVLMFCIITFSSPDLRRAFASVPGLFMAFVIIRPQVPTTIQALIRKRIWPIILIIGTFFQLYVMLK